MTRICKRGHVWDNDKAHQCRECQRMWSKANPERMRAAGVRCREKNPDMQLRASLKSSYGITLEEYRKLETEQKKQCAICRLVKKLDVDHNHTTGKIRGLLCRTCNTAIGFLKEDKKLLDNAVAYLRKHQ